MCLGNLIVREEACSECGFSGFYATTRPALRTRAMNAIMAGSISLLHFG
jgi:hypothetical protein